jgi:ribosomal protein L34
MANDPLGNLFVRRIAAQGEITVLNGQVKLLKEEVKHIDQNIRTFIEDNKLEAVRKHGYLAKMSTKVGVKVEDWEKVYEYIFDKRATWLLYKRLKQDALQEMYEQEEQLPGASIHEYLELTVAKTKST